MCIDALSPQTEAELHSHIETIGDFNGRKIQDLTSVERSRLSHAVEGLVVIAAGVGLALVPGFYLRGIGIALKGAISAGRAIHQQILDNRAAIAQAEQVAQQALNIPPPPNIAVDMRQFSPYNPPPWNDYWIGCP